MINPYRRADVNFTYIQEIGQEGKNSKVYLSKDDNLNQEVVVKEVSKSGVNSEEFFREARLLYISSHPNVVQINFAAQDEEYIYISMPFYSKGSLSKKMEEHNLTAREIIRYSIHFLSGLHHIHTKGLMHFDIKPNNIMLSDRNEALLAGFGLAECIDTSGMAMPQSIYTIHTGPEYFYQRDFNFSYDIYQAGLTMYRMAVGADKFTEETNLLFHRNQIQNDIIGGDFPSKCYQPNIPNKLKRTINKCLAIDPCNRYQSVLDVLNDLSAIDSGALDWRAIGDGEWEKIKDGVIFNLSVAGDTSICYRTNENGRKTKYGQMCKSGLTSAGLYKLLKDNG